MRGRNGIAIVVFLLSSSAGAVAAIPLVPPSGWVALGGPQGDRGGVAVRASSTESLTVSVSLPGFSTVAAAGDDGRAYTSVTAPGAGLYETGAPAVPVYGSWILVPNGTRPELEIFPGAPRVYEDVLLPPVPLPTPDLDGAPPAPFFRRDGVYGRDGDVPGVFARLEPVMTMRGQACTILRLYPFQQNPAARRLAVYPDLAVTVRFRGRPAPRPARLQSPEFDAVLRSAALNGAAVLPPPGPTAAGAAPGGGFTFGWDYVILTTPEFSTAADTLAAWKKKQGFKAWVTSSPLFKSWKAADIRSLIQQAYDGWDLPPRYILIIGDAEFVPTFYETWHPYNNIQGMPASMKNSQGYTGTDLYYSLLDGNDLLPDLGIGRISVDTPAQAAAAVGRIIDYERTPTLDAGYYSRATLAAHFQDYILKADGIADSRFAQTSEDLALYLSKPAFGIGKSVVRVYDADQSVKPAKWNNNQYVVLNNFGGGPAGNPGDPVPVHLRKPGFAWDGDAADIRAALAAGTFLLTHRDHGGRAKWSHPKFDDADIQSTAISADMSPVIWSVNCQTGWFDDETDFKKKTGIKDRTPFDAASPQATLAMSEWWERHCALGGPAGIIAGTRVTDSIYNDRLMWGWTDALWPGFILTHGGAAPIPGAAALLAYGKLYMAAHVPDNKWRKTHIEVYHWFGDPSMQIRTRMPDVVLADFDSRWPRALRADLLSIHVDRFTPPAGPVPFPGATVAVTRPGPVEERWVAITDDAGEAVFPGFATADAGEYAVTVTGPDAVPYEGVFTAEAGDAAGLRFASPVSACDGYVQVRLADLGAGGGDVIGAEVGLTTGAGDEEGLTLYESPAGSGIFTGVIPVAPGAPTGGDGVLQAADGDMLLVQYHDLDDGAGGDEWVSDQAVFDCAPPDFAGLTALHVEEDDIVLEWDAAADEHGPVTYRIYRGTGPEFAPDVPLGTTGGLVFRDAAPAPGVTFFYKVRARDALGNEDANEREESAATGAVRLLSPDGGETILGGAPWRIEWEPGPSVEYVNLAYSVDGGDRWREIARGEGGTSYVWTTPATRRRRGRCLVRVTAFDADDVRAGRDRSRGVFAIVPLVVTAPGAWDSHLGEILTAGTTRTVSWTTARDDIIKVKLHYSRNGGRRWKKIAALDGNPGSYEWLVPGAERSRRRCLVRVSLIRPGGRPGGAGRSERFFTIAP